MGRMLLLALGWSLLSAIPVLFGCTSSGFDPGFVPENIYPETTLSVGPGAVVPGGTVRLNWFGWDPNGEIVGFDIRSAPNDTMSDWRTVVCTDSVFLLPQDLNSWAFWVRAVDDDGAADATPESVAFVFRE